MTHVFRPGYKHPLASPVPRCQDCGHERGHRNHLIDISKTIHLSGKPPEGTVFIVKKRSDGEVKIHGAKADFIIVDDIMSQPTVAPTQAQITQLYFALRTAAQDVEREKKLLEGDQSRDVVRDTDDKTLARLLRARRP